jgi:hypothetical protein
MVQLKCFFPKFGNFRQLEVNDMRCVTTVALGQVQLALDGKLRKHKEMVAANEPTLY